MEMIFTHTIPYIFKSLGFIFGCLQQHTRLGYGGGLWGKVGGVDEEVATCGWFLVYWEMKMIL